MKNAVSRLVSLTAALLLLFSLCTPVSAAGEEDYTGKSAQDVLDAFAAENKLPIQSCAIGYYNTVTGEEAYFNGEHYFPTASMYKVPLCMYYAERIGTGEYTWDTDVWGLPLRELISDTLVYSNNTYAGMLFGALGTYKQYRALTAPYMGIDAATATKEYMELTQNTAREMIFCLNELYTHSEKYPEVIDYLLEANRGEYFCKTEGDYEIAHKYGYLDSEARHVNDCAIVYTDEPFLLVMFTVDIYDAETKLGRLCETMTDYNVFTAALPEESAPEAEDETIVPTASPTVEPLPTAPVPTETAPTGSAGSGIPTVSPVVWIASASLAVAVFFLWLLCRRKGKT